MNDSLAGIPGILFEDKGPILTVHYRNVLPEYFDRVHQVVGKTMEAWKDRWKIARGKMVFEIRPKVDFNKGKALREILQSAITPKALPVYLGDDPEDEGAFRAIKGKGIPVFVGDARIASEADHYLKDPSKVLEFLRRCLGLLKNG